MACRTKYCTGTAGPTWRYADSLEAVTSHLQPLYLSSRGSASDLFRSGTLNPTRAAYGAIDEYRYDPRDVSLSDLELAVGPWTRTDQRLMHAHGGNALIYHSAPFDQAVEIAYPRVVAI